MLWLWGPMVIGAAERGEGSDLEIGGTGGGQGKFGQLVDMTFDADNHLYVLDGGSVKKGVESGNFLVQRFDGTGRFLGEFSVYNDTSILPEQNAPARLAVDRQGMVYVTQPLAGEVWQFDARGQLLAKVKIPGAFAVTTRHVGAREEILVAANLPKNDTSQLEIIRPDGTLAAPLPLKRKVSHCQDLAADREGRVYVLADTNQVYQFDAVGKLRDIIGGGTRTRAEDGSELLHSITVDTRGCLYGLTYGNPSFVVRFDPGITTVTRREGQFKWADPWSSHSGYTLLAVDQQDRLWVGTTRNSDPQTNPRYHFQPCILRTATNFLDKGRSQVSEASALVLGLKAGVETKLPYNISHDLAPVLFDFVVKPGNRRVREVTVEYRVYDMYKRLAGDGRFSLPLQEGVEARQPCSFKPSGFGWYTISCELTGQGQRLMGVGAHVGVTPHFAGLPELAAGESPGGWNDAPRQAFTGLKLQRVNTGSGLDKLEKEVEAAAKYGLTLLVQFENLKECAPERVRAAVTRFQGRVKYWEIVNEPNFSISPTGYVAMVKELYPLIKSIDPQAQVLCPDVCGIQLSWYEAFYKAGGKDFCDILSIHDYEGDESIDPGHWRWKLGELRKRMAAHGDTNKAIWQTERAIPAVRGSCFQGGNQAVRVLLQRDVQESLGVPGEHNLHYYLNAGGYAAVPSYLWSEAGPHPAVLALRTRHAMIRGRAFADTLDFGPTGNKMFMGLRFNSAEGTTIILRNLGSADLPLEWKVSGGPAVEMLDAFGNSQRLPVSRGSVRTVARQMPCYLRLAPGQTLTPPNIDFGRNLAAEAQFSYSAPVEAKSDWTTLTNGILEVTHAGNPYQHKYWNATLPQTPQTFDIAFAHPRTVSKLLVFGVRADNPHCALLDYDLQYFNGRTWTTIEAVRTPCPSSDLIHTPLCKSQGWYLDNNFFMHQFKPVKTEKVRLVIQRTTRGFLPDTAALEAKGGTMPARLQLREIEVYE